MTITCLTTAHHDTLQFVAENRVSFEPAAGLWLLDRDDCDPHTTAALDGLFELGLIRRPRSYQTPGPAVLTGDGELAVAR